MAQNPYMFGAPPFYSLQQNTAGSPSTMPFTSSQTAPNASFDPNVGQIPGLMFAAGSSNGFPFQPSSQMAPRPQFSPPNTTQAAMSVPPFSSNTKMQPSSKKPAEPPREEGELSEGEFEDLYEPKEPTIPSRPAPPSKHVQAPAVASIRAGSAGDADGSSIYDSGSPQGEAVVESTSTSQPAAEQGEVPDDEWEPTLTQRERSRSYSPCLLPSEVDSRAATTKNSTNGSNPRKDSLHKENAILPTEAKKKAQEAILALWPHKVRFQNYIDEGFDQNVIKSLFKDLGLDTTMAKTARNTTALVTDLVQAPTKTSPKLQGTPGESPRASQTTTADQGKAPEPSTKISDPKPTVKSAAEERKDKIARKLAAKAQKTTTAPKPAAQPISKDDNASQATSTPPVKTKTRAETNALLHQKLAALKKKQGKVAAEIEVTKLSGIATLPAKPTDPPVNLSHENASLPAKPQVATPLTTNLPAALGKDGGVETLPKVSALMSSPQPGSDKIRNLKRPVASDFDHQSSSRIPLKRTRTQDTLIIDVSDSEDDDVEMEVGSPVDEHAGSDESANPITRPFGSFPQLSDHTRQRHASSPASSGAPAREGGVKIGLLHGRIEEMKRKIAEAEAKKKKPIDTNSEIATPISQAQTPQVRAEGSPGDTPVDTATPSSIKSGTPTDQGSAKLPKVPRAMKRKSLQRRDRIVSFDMPSIEAALKAKQDKLKFLVAQAAELELEVQASLVEKQKLAAEMDQLSESSDDESVESKEQAEHVSERITDSRAAEAEPEVESPPQQNLENPPHPEHETYPETSTSISRTSSVAFPENADATETRPSNEASEQEHPSLKTVSMPTDATDRNLNGSSKDHERQEVDSRSDLSMDEADDDESSEDDDVSMKTSDESSSDDDEDDDYEPTASGGFATTQDPESSATGLGEVEKDPTMAPEIDIPNATQGLDNTSLEGSSDPAREFATGGDAGAAEEARETQPSSFSEQPLLTRGQVPQNAEVSEQDLLSYHSPLSYFRSYRFHPRFLEDVNGGLKSLTYSSKIDPMQPICSYSLAGEACPKGKDCDNQHFEDIVPPDSDIITQIGSSDMFSGETRTRFITGLRQVLSELKMKKIKDFESITKAIIEYRASFLGDKTKVLPLDGVIL